MKSYLMIAGLALLSLQVQANPCLSDAQLKALQLEETRYLTEKIPPAFKHAYEDQKIKLSLDLSDGKGLACGVRLTAILPDNEIVAAKQLLDQDPAKRIVLFSQGYSLPENNTSVANFSVDPNTNKIAHNDILQTAELGKLRASIEMMYALLSQSRANIDPNLPNMTPWRAAFRESQINACHQKKSSGANASSNACECQADQLSKHVSERQLDHIYYVRTNPYAKATGAIKNFDAIEKEIIRTCNTDATATVK